MSPWTKNPPSRDPRRSSQPPADDNRHMLEESKNVRQKARERREDLTLTMRVIQKTASIMNWPKGGPTLLRMMTEATTNEAPSSCLEQVGIA